MPASDTYIEKDSSVNAKIERMRLGATANLMTSGPTVIVATVSCIYGIGNPEEYRKFSIELNTGMQLTRKEFVNRLLDMQYERNEQVVEPSKFSIKGTVFTVAPAYDESLLRVTLEDDKVSNIQILDPINRKPTKELKYYRLFPAKHYLIDEKIKKNAIKQIREELNQLLPKLGPIEAHRLKQRTNYDLELIEEVGYCNGIENYSRHFDGRKEGDPPFCLVDFLPEDALIIIDESHVTLPQLHGMYHGDKSRKKNLIDYGFRLKSAYDNRPLKWEEFEKKMGERAVFVSATPAEYEKETSEQIVEQLVRPTGIVDPQISVCKTEGQMDDLILRVKERASKGYRTLVTTLTKRMAEDLAEYMSQKEVRVRYMHSEIDTITRSEIIRQLRLGEFDVLVGINLLREGLDIPEVGLVAILDADKQGFLRNCTSLIQTIGRAARNADSQVVMYADKISSAMQEAIDETDRRRNVQIEFNKEHGIVAKTIEKKVAQRLGPDDMQMPTSHLTTSDFSKQIVLLQEQMMLAAENLDFEQAIAIREQIKEIKDKIDKKQKKKDWQDSKDESNEKSVEKSKKNTSK